MRWWPRRTDPGEPRRVTGPPPSANGASSMHLFWELDGDFAAAEVTVEVLAPPAVERLYFWALQTTFSERGTDLGAAHLGLQWHPAHPGSTAVNWGGYGRDGTELHGTHSTLPSATGNPNTRDLPWQPGRAYRLRIERGSAPGRWRGLVTGPDGAPTEVRELAGGGTHLRSLMTWSEVFARCDDPPTTVRWSRPFAWDDGGAVHRPATVGVNYQRHDDGGCTNTDTFADQTGICQRTAGRRHTPSGGRLVVPGTARPSSATAPD